MECPELEPRCSCCYPPFWSDRQASTDFTPDPIGQLMEQKYLQSRAVQGGAHPRGKYARNPPPLSGIKLIAVNWWRDDADEYHRYLWAKQRESGACTTNDNPIRNKKRRTFNFPHMLKAVDATSSDTGSFIADAATARRRSSSAASATSGTRCGA
jgi:hypothetical protein